MKHRPIGRGHAADDLSGHRTVDTVGTEAVSSHGSGLVDRATHIEAHAGTDDGADDGLGTAVEGCDPLLEHVHDPSEGLSEHAQEEHAANKGSEDRDDQYGHQTSAPLGKLPGLHPENEVADDEAHEQAAQEAGLGHGADVADDEAGNDAGALGDGVGHEGAQDRNREVHRVGAEHVDAPPEAAPGEGLHTGKGRGPATGNLGIVVADLPAAKTLCESSEDTAGNDHGDHVGDTRHDGLHHADLLDLRHGTPSFLS